jgi:4-hydroxyphenylacetate 3-monooxygenase
VKFYKLAWRGRLGIRVRPRAVRDVLCRCDLTKGHAFRTYDWNTATSLLDRMLASYDVADEIDAKTDLTSPTKAVA